MVVENIHRHYQLGWTSPRHATVFATDEVGNPTILATLTVIGALLPLAFVSGLMGPYMRPIPINASAAMVFSLLVAFVVSPWLTYRLFKKHAEQMAAGGHPAPDSETAEETKLHRLYQKLFAPLLASAVKRWALLGTVAALLVAAVAFFPARLAVVKMLPHDNKSELQVVVDMPEGTTLEQTAAVARELALAARTRPEVTDVQTYVGTSSPFNFNGLVRHYFLRSGPLVADLQVNLLPKHERDRASHPFAKELRTLLAPIGGEARRQRQGGRGPAGAAGALDPGGRGLRADARPARRHRPPGAGGVRVDARGGGRRLVRRGPRRADRARGGPREGGARRGLGRGDRAHAAGRPRRGRGGAARRLERPRGGAAASCGSSARSARASTTCSPSTSTAGAGSSSRCASSSPRCRRRRARSSSTTRTCVR